MYENLFGKVNSNEPSINAKILKTSLFETTFGKAYNDTQIDVLLNLVNNPNNGISLKLIKSSRKYLKFNEENKPFIEISKFDERFYNIFFYLTLVVLISIVIFMFFDKYLLSHNDFKVNVNILLMLFILSGLIYVISDYLDAKVLKKQFESADL